MASTRIYHGLIRTIDPHVPLRLRPLWEHPAGPKTVFFWSPIVKWALVIAAMSDVIDRPVENISASQSASLAATGLIWSRYCVVIKPKNYALMSVNMLVAATNLTQLGRVAYAQVNGSIVESS
ncbi:hypothetical protein RDWZM_003508 [Blomia tropicalis]|uniref:Mitochondrial pyruvate carrier n=1 Tax=Blomia tropicalis TaxID=40697 RepID=A0A9Q0RQY1_BLOTA|nr:Mitochondrial pyruvate carrier 2 [Blomia tropicalis]KAJ6224963.1 hypothetical protein RDWZM_003508 [Blomia tropicalis]